MSDSEGAEAVSDSGKSIETKILSCVTKNSRNMRLSNEHKLKKACAKFHGVNWSVLKPHYQFAHQVKGDRLVSALIPKVKVLVLP